MNNKQKNNYTRKIREMVRTLEKIEHNLDLEIQVIVKTIKVGIEKENLEQIISQIEFCQSTLDEIHSSYVSLSNLEQNIKEIWNEQKN